jgi:hypothetical protein
VFPIFEAASHRWAFTVGNVAASKIGRSLRLLTPEGYTAIWRGLVVRAANWKRSSVGWFEGKNSLKPDPIDFGGVGLVLGRS